ncbi:MAG: pyridoxamine 5'-phosphate oxidase family protein [Streptosporangiales bacterium]|nr:pyridoxamine 5'-phosphate oxidase family protein [Streptosporangiales bacterium]
MDFSEAERRFLGEQRQGRLSTIGRDGFPQVKPVGFAYNPELGTIDISGMNMAASAKYKNVRANPKVAFVADDVPDPERGAEGVRFLEVRGTAETAETAERDETGHLAPEIIRIRPRRVIAFNIGGPGLRARTAGAAAEVNERWPA